MAVHSQEQAPHTWGDAFYVGLTSIELLDAMLAPIVVELHQIDASPRDLNDLEEVDEDPRTLDKLLDGVCCTTDDRHMWMAPFNKVLPTGLLYRDVNLPPTGNYIRINFGDCRHEIAGFNIWNYNKNIEDTCRGVKEFSVYCDDKYVATFLCRKAPGHIHFDFKQLILINQPPSRDPSVKRRVAQVPPMAPQIPSHPTGQIAKTSLRCEPGNRGHSSSREGTSNRVQQQYETALHPCGFIFKLVLLCTWSDVHYIGLDGVEFYDLEGKPLRPKRVHSNHHSVRNLPGMENDIRTEDNLLLGDPGTSRRMWLSPLVQNSTNSLEFVFDEPTHMTYLRLWNYARTPARGARDVEIFFDDFLVYKGIRSSP